MEELSYLDQKVLKNSFKMKKTVYTYEELQILVAPYHVEDYIISSKILYEKEPNLFELIPPLKEKILSYQAPQNTQKKETKEKPKENKKFQNKVFKEIN